MQSKTLDAWMGSLFHEQLDGRERLAAGIPSMYRAPARTAEGEGPPPCRLASSGPVLPQVLTAEKRSCRSSSKPVPAGPGPPTPGRQLSARQHRDNLRPLHMTQGQRHAVASVFPQLFIPVLLKPTSVCPARCFNLAQSQETDKKY